MNIPLYFLSIVTKMNSVLCYIYITETPPEAMGICEDGTKQNSITVLYNFVSFCDLYFDNLLSLALSPLSSAVNWETINEALLLHDSLRMPFMVNSVGDNSGYAKVYLEKKLTVWLCTVF